MDTQNGLFEVELWSVRAILYRKICELRIKKEDEERRESNEGNRQRP